MKLLKLAAVLFGLVAFVPQLSADESSSIAAIGDAQTHETYATGDILANDYIVDGTREEPIVFYINAAIDRLGDIPSNHANYQTIVNYIAASQDSMTFYTGNYQDAINLRFEGSYSLPYALSRWQTNYLGIQSVYDECEAEAIWCKGKFLESMAASALANVNVADAWSAVVNAEYWLDQSED